MKTRLILATLLLVSAAFQYQGPMSLTAADPLISPATFQGFFPPEGGLRWSGPEGAIVFPDPGPRTRVRIEVVLAGWRPVGIESPRVAITALGQSVVAHPGASAEMISLETTTSGWWRSDLVVQIRSDTFDPGGGDPRRLGVRVQEARLIPTTRGLRLPPMGAIVGTAVGAILLAFTLGRGGVATPWSGGFALAFVVLAAALHALARPYIALGLWPAVILLALFAVLAWAMPRVAQQVAGLLR